MTASERMRWMIVDSESNFHFQCHNLHFLFFSSLVESLVRKWSPLVWLAPNEKFLPGDVKTFLSNVHAEREKPNTKKIKDIGDNYGNYYEDLVYYDGSGSQKGTSIPNNRKRRNFEKDTLLEYIFELPIDDASENWFLVTNEELGEETLSCYEVEHA
jgi:hypothetical protein